MLCFSIKAFVEKLILLPLLTLFSIIILLPLALCLYLKSWQQMYEVFIDNKLIVFSEFNKLVRDVGAKEPPLLTHVLVAGARA